MSRAWRSARRHGFYDVSIALVTSLTGLSCSAPSTDSTVTAAVTCGGEDATVPRNDALDASDLGIDVQMDAQVDAPGEGFGDGASDTHTEVGDAKPDSDAGVADPDDAAACMGMWPVVPAFGGTLCDAVVRLEYASHRVLAHRMICGRFQYPGIDEARTSLLAQAALGLDGAPELKMSGLDASYWHSSKGTGDPAGFAIVDASSARVLVYGTSAPSGGALGETAWNRPWDTTRCFPEFEPLDARPVVAPGEVPIDDALAKKVAHDAWYGPYGAWAEEFGGCGDDNTYKASVFRWAPTLGGAFAEWIVVLHLGAGCPVD